MNRRGSTSVGSSKEDNIYPGQGLSVGGSVSTCAWWSSGINYERGIGNSEFKGGLSDVQVTEPSDELVS